MSTDRKWRVGVAGAVVVLGVSALVQANGGLISSAIADESPKETATHQAKVQKAVQATQPAVQQPAARKGTAQKAATKKKSYW